MGWPKFFARVRARERKGERAGERESGRERERERQRESDRDRDTEQARDRESKQGRERELINSVVPVANRDPAGLESRNQSDLMDIMGRLQSTLTFQHVLAVQPF